MSNVEEWKILSCLFLTKSFYLKFILVMNPLALFCFLLKGGKPSGREVKERKARLESVLKEGFEFKEGAPLSRSSPSFPAPPPRFSFYISRGRLGTRQWRHYCSREIRFGGRANSRARILPSPEKLLPLATQGKQLRDHVFRADRYKK